jgi:DNA polymerase (family 10)
VIGDVDLLVSSQQPIPVIEHFVARSGAQQVLAQGETKVSIVIEGGLQCDLRVVSDTEFPFALAYFTGSKEHNIVMRQRAIARGLRLNEYGLFRSKEETRDPALLVPCHSEEELFEKLGLPFIPPELREDLGEFDECDKGPLRRLIEWTDLKGSLHNHSNWSDGRGTIDEIADYMEELGFSYWAITDHSRSSFQANGLDSSRLLQQIAAVAEVNERLSGTGTDFRLLTGSEVDILSEGKLDFENPVLDKLDVVVASIHHGFSQNESEMTRRLIRAAENPNVHILGHLTGRLLLQRESYKVNQEAVIDACAATGTWIELNANPHRFDLDWRLWPYARQKGVKCVINCDAHRNEHAGFLRLGAGIARKGWLSKEDVVNTVPLATLRRELTRKKNSR